MYITQFKINNPVQQTIHQTSSFIVVKSFNVKLLSRHHNLAHDLERFRATREI